MTGVRLAAILVVLVAGCGSPVIGPARDGDPAVMDWRPFLTFCLLWANHNPPRVVLGG